MADEFKEQILEMKKTKTYREIIEELNLNMTINALKKQIIRYRVKKDISTSTPQKRLQEMSRERETITIDDKGNSLIEKVIELTEEEKLKPELILSKIVSEPNDWKITNLRISNWQQHTKEQITKNLYAVKIGLKPNLDEPNIEESIKIANEKFEKGIRSFKLEKRTKDDSPDKDKLIEFPAVELHLGKLAWHGETDENYDYKIASERFRIAIEKTLELQEQEQASEIVYYIGNDFFNSEANSKTTKDTPQQNDVRWQKMFEVGLDLQLRALKSFRERFNKVNVRIVAGNHDRQMTYFLYMALKQAFKSDDIIEFSDNHKLTQAFRWGDCVIFTNHGDINYKRFVQSLPAEFPVEWGSCKYREAHLGHLHSQQAYEEGGLTVRRISSPSGVDFWHYEQRYNSSIAGHQLFVWNKNEGLKAQHFISYEREENKKKLIKRR